MLTPDTPKPARSTLPGRGHYSSFSNLERGAERNDKNTILKDLSRDAANVIVPFSLASDGNLTRVNGSIRLISEQEYIAGLLFKEIAAILEIQVPSVREAGIEKWENPEGPSLYDAIVAQANGAPAIDLREIARRDRPTPTIAGFLHALGADTPAQTLEVVVSALADATLPSWALDRIRQSPSIAEKYRQVFAEELIGRGVQIVNVTGPSRYLDITDRPFLSQVMLLCGRACGGLPDLVKDFEKRRKRREDSPPLNPLMATVAELREGEVFQTAARFGALLDELARNERTSTPEWRTAANWLSHFVRLHQQLGEAHRRIRSMDSSPENVELLNAVRGVRSADLIQASQAYPQLVKSSISNPFQEELLLGAPEAQLSYRGPVTTEADQQFALERITALLKGELGPSRPGGPAQSYSDYLRERLPHGLFNYQRPPQILESKTPVIVSFNSDWHSLDGSLLGSDTQEFLALPGGDEIGIFATTSIEGVPHVLTEQRVKVGALARNASGLVAGLKEEPQLLHALPTAHLESPMEFSARSAEFLKELGINHVDQDRALLGTSVRQIRRSAGVLLTQVVASPSPTTLEAAKDPNDPLSFSIRSYLPLTQLISHYFSGNLHCTALFANALAYAALNNIPTALPFSIQPRDSTDISLCLDLMGLRSTLAVAQVTMPSLPSYFKATRHVASSGSSLTLRDLVLKSHPRDGQTFEKTAPVVSSSFHDSVEIICYSASGDQCYMAAVFEPNPMGQSRSSLPSTIHCEHGPRRLSGVGAAFDKPYSSLDEIRDYAARIVEQTLGLPAVELAYLGYDYPQPEVSTERVYRFITPIAAEKGTIRSANPLQNPFWIRADHVLQSAIYGDVRDLGATIGAALLYLANSQR
jgi:hypothetical protein